MVVIQDDRSCYLSAILNVCLSENIFDDFNTVVLLVSMTFVLDRVNCRAPVTMLSTVCFVDFDLQGRSKLVTSVQLEKPNKTIDRIRFCSLQ